MKECDISKHTLTRPAYFKAVGTTQTLGSTRDLSRPPQGGYNPPVFMRHPPTIWSSKGVIRGVFPGGVYMIVMEWVINVVKYWH